MGPDENITAGALYFKSEDRGYIQILANAIPFLELEHDIDEETFQKVLNIRSTDTFRFKLHIKNFIKMSKKRFKKILMSKGISRDDADFLCYLVGWFKGKVSFHEIYFCALFLRPAVRFYEVFDYIMTKGEISEWTNIKQQMTLI